MLSSVCEDCGREVEHCECGDYCYGCGELLQGLQGPVCRDCDDYRAETGALPEPPFLDYEPV